VLGSRLRNPVFVGLVLGAVLAASRGQAAPKGAAASQRAREAASKLSDVDSAEKYYANMDYENANAIASRAITGSGLTHDQLVRSYRILGLTFATLGKEDQAREAFMTLLMLSPEFELDPNLSPKVTGPFLEARGYWRGQTVKPGVEVVATMHSNDSARLVVTTRDPTQIVSNVNVGYRWGADGAFTTRPVAIGDSVTVRIPAAPSTSDTRLDYYAQGIDAKDNVVFEVGNATAPKTVMVDIPAAVAAVPVVVAPEAGHGGGKSVFASPYFWTAAAVVVAGGALGAYFALRPKAPDSATLTAGAECGAMPCR
jgi:hypothetical protein